MTATQARTLWREWTNEKFTGPVPDATVNHYLERGMEAFNRRVKFHVEDKTDVTLVAGTQEYTLGVDVVEVVWVELDGVLLAKTDQDHLRRDPDSADNWRNATGTPRRYYLVGRKIGFFPKPNAGAASKAPVIRSVTRPDAFDDSPLATIEEQDQPLVVAYAAGLWLATPNGGFRTAAAKTFFDMFETESAAVADSYRARMLS